MTRQVAATTVLGRLAVGVGIVVVLFALYLGFHIEGTPEALARSAKGHRIAVPAVLAVVAGLIALLARPRRWALPVACGGAVAAVVAGLLAVVLPIG